jgi:hypothetical protein
MHNNANNCKMCKLDECKSLVFQLFTLFVLFCNINEYGNNVFTMLFCSIVLDDGCKLAKNTKIN